MNYLGFKVHPQQQGLKARVVANTTRKTSTLPSKSAITGCFYR